MKKVTRREAREVLRKSLEKIRTFGWVQGRTESTYGYCALGAVWASIRETYVVYACESKISYRCIKELARHIPIDPKNFIIEQLVTSTPTTLPQLVRTARKLGLTEGATRSAAQSLIEHGAVRLNEKMQLTLTRHIQPMCRTENAPNAIVGYNDSTTTTKRDIELLFKKAIRSLR